MGLAVLVAGMLLTAGCGVKEPAEAAEGLEGPAPRFDKWTIIGPGGGGTMEGPVVSPRDPNVAFLHCDMTGGYVTTDGARSWRMFNLRTGIGVFAFDPLHPSTVYAGNVALWRSEDTGRTWSMVFPDPKKHTVEHMSGDHADYSLTSDDPIYPGGEEFVRAIAVDPDDSNRIYVAFPAKPLLVSTDYGKRWDWVRDGKAQTIPRGREAVLAVHVEKAAKGKEKRVYVVCDTGVYVGIAGGTGGAWELLPAPAGGKITYASVGTARGASEPTIYVMEIAGASVRSRLYVSADGGRTWGPLGDGIAASISKSDRLVPSRLVSVACSAQEPSTAYVSLSLGGGRSDVAYAIVKTTDAGRSWNIVFREEGKPAANLSPSWIEFRASASADDSSVYFSEARLLGVAPTDPNVCYATDLFRTYRTLDGGKTWQQVNSVAVIPPGLATTKLDFSQCHWTTRGLDVTTCYGVHWDPLDPVHMFITYTDIGLFQSADGGKSWFGSTEGVPAAWRNTTYWVVLDPQVKGLMWGVFSGTHDIPRPKMWRRRDTDAYQGGVCVSTDGGLHWRISNEGMPQTCPTHILMDPTSPRGARVLYVAAFGRGVFKSIDNGKTWTLKNKGIEKAKPFAWRITRADDGTLYLVVARRSEGRIGDADDGALYKSTDGAENWVEMPLPGGTNGPNALALDPTDKRRMYLSAWGLSGRGLDTGGGVFLSTDGGETWKNIFSDSQHVYDLTVDPKDSKVLYICGFDSGAWRSADAGKTWSCIRGYNFKWGHRVIPDPADSGKIYITTFGGSVWHGPAAGDPGATGDIPTPVPGPQTENP
jgi:photosystem II stability/assembly factor-like uncharacterized protein